jgi:hypothetical protein
MVSGAPIENSKGISFARPIQWNDAGEANRREQEELMSGVSVRFRGVCCFIDKTNGENFGFKRVVLPTHEHTSALEEHLSIIEYFADDLIDVQPPLKRVKFTRPGDTAQYEYIQIPQPSLIELQGVVTAGTFMETPNLADLRINLDELTGPTQLKASLVGPPSKVSASLVNAVIDLPAGMLTPGQPEPFLTEFGAPVVGFTPRAVARWLEHIMTLNGEFALKLTPLDPRQSGTTLIRFRRQTRMISIANEPLRMIVGQFVPRPEGSHTHPGLTPQQQATGHFDMYWNLVADPPFRPAPLPYQSTSPGCGPSNKP